jgi:endonuclease/exonuclease/phosphatase family metal-dependent hydrolase
MLLIIILVVILVIILALCEQRTSIWKEYESYISSGQKSRIDFSVALAGWNRDARRFANVPNPHSGAGAGATRICTWNVHEWKHADGAQANIDEIKKVLCTIDADVLCLQEYQPRADVDGLLAGMYVDSFVELINDNVAFGNAVFSRLPFSSSPRVMDLPVNPDVGERRIAIIVEIGSVRIANVHLEVRNNYPNVHEYRYPQIDAVLDSAPDVIVGDFNVGYVSGIDRKFHAHVKDSGWRNLWDGHFRKRAMLSNIYGGLVDHVYVRSVRSVYRSHAYVTNVSDHYPIIADIKIEDMFM